MKPTGIFGLILIAVGIVMLAYGGYTSFTTKENVAKLGPIEVNKHEEHPVPIGPIVGGVCIVGGIILLVTGKRALSPRSCFCLLLALEASGRFDFFFWD